MSWKIFAFSSFIDARVMTDNKFEELGETRNTIVWELCSFLSYGKLIHSTVEKYISRRNQRVVVIAVKGKYERG